MTGKIKEKKIKSSINDGFSLVEVLLYLAIVSVMILVITTFSFTFFQSRIKNQTIAEVEQQGIQVMNMISFEMRNAEDFSINAPDDITLNSTDPIRFYLQNERLFVQRGVTGSPIELTSSRLIVSDVLFEDLTRSGTSGTIRFNFTLTHVNPEGRNEYDYQKTFISSATIRS